MTKADKWFEAHAELKSVKDVIAKCEKGMVKTKHETEFGSYVLYTFRDGSQLRIGSGEAIANNREEARSDQS